MRLLYLTRIGTMIPIGQVKKGDVFELYEVGRDQPYYYRQRYQAIGDFDENEQLVDVTWSNRAVSIARAKEYDRVMIFEENTEVTEEAERPLPF